MKHGWMHKVRKRMLALLLGVALAVIATISLTAIPAWPVIGVAFAAVAVAVNSMAGRLHVDRPLCLQCGHDLSDLPAPDAAGPYGSVCSSCGALHQPALAYDPADPGPDARPDAEA